MDTRTLLLLGSVGLAGYAACMVYDPSLINGPPGASGGGGSGSGTDVGGGPPVACTTTDNCPGADDECKTRACNAGLCGFNFTKAGTELRAQDPGDCKRIVCDGQGNPDAIQDDDPRDDQRACTVDKCDNAIPSSTPQPEGTACSGPEGAKLCNAAGDCVECLKGADCSSTVCDAVTFKCVLAQCGDGEKNGGETDVDCGGPDCGDCAIGSSCMSGVDCVGGTCTAGKCAVSCTDGQTNGGEGDVDCGGPCPMKCDLGQGCSTASDCSSNNCVGNTCFLDHLVINEVDYDQIDNDTAEFIEIYNGTGAPQSLSGISLVLINGADSVNYLIVDLSKAGATLQNGQYLVVGAASLTVPGSALKLSFAAVQDNIQNGPADGIVLIDTKASPPKLLDALSYEGSITSVSVTGLSGKVSLVEGTALSTSVADSNTEVRSLVRFPSGLDTNNAATDWTTSASPSPGAANVP